MADRINAGPVPARERFVHNCHPRGCGLVRFREDAADSNWDSQGFEETCRDGAELDGAGRRMSVNRARKSFAVAAGQQRAGCRDLRHLGQRR